jgi:fructan beta-fructosidase
MTFRFGKLKMENVSLFKFVVQAIYYRLGELRVSEKQEMLVGYASDTQEVYVDRTRSGCSDFHEDFAGRHAASLETVENRLDIHIYVDRSPLK